MSSMTIAEVTKEELLQVLNSINDNEHRVSLHVNKSITKLYDFYVSEVYNIVKCSGSIYDRKLYYCNGLLIYMEV